VAYSEEARAELISPLSTMTPNDPDGLIEDLLASDDRSMVARAVIQDKES